MKRILAICLAAVLLIYPVVIYYGLHYLNPFWLSLTLLALLGLRFLVMRQKLSQFPWLLPLTLGGIAVILLTLFTDNTLGFKLYPFMMNLIMFCVFIYSYVKPPTVIEVFARLTEPNLSKAGVSYVTKVTLIWCFFFLINGSISLYTAFFTHLETWMLYNGLVSYILMGLLMAGEFIVRLKVKENHKESNI